MTTPSDQDQRLREAFAALRARETPSAPPFGRALRGRPERPSPKRPLWRFVVVSLAAAVIVAIVMTRRAAPGPEEFLRTVGQLRSSTDFLLEVSGTEFLRTVPRIGRTDQWFPLSGPSEGHRL
jgi:hypothetical protein